MLVPKDERILLQHYTHQNIEKMIVHKHVKTKGSPSAWSSHLNWDMGKSISRQPYPFSYSNLGPLAAQFGRLPLHQALLSQAFWCSQLYATILIKKYVNLTLSIQEHFSLVAWQVRYSHWYVPTTPYSSAHLFSFYKCNHLSCSQPQYSGWKLKQHSVLILLSRLHHHRGEIWLVDGIRKPLGFQAYTGMFLINSTPFASDATHIVGGVELHARRISPEVQSSQAWWISQLGGVLHAILLIATIQHIVMIIPSRNISDAFPNLVLCSKVERCALNRHYLTCGNCVFINWSDVLPPDLNWMIQDVTRVMACQVPVSVLCQADRSGFVMWRGFHVKS